MTLVKEHRQHLHRGTLIKNLLNQVRPEQNIVREKRSILGQSRPAVVHSPRSAMLNLRVQLQSVRWAIPNSQDPAIRRYIQGQNRITITAIRNPALILTEKTCSLRITIASVIHNLLAVIPTQGRIRNHHVPIQGVTLHRAGHRTAGVILLPQGRVVADHLILPPLVPVAVVVAVAVVHAHPAVQEADAGRF